MKCVVLFIILFLLPTITLAVCSSDGYTVVYVNGILTTEQQTKIDLSIFQKVFENNSTIGGVSFYTGYNESHIGGAGDIIESASQFFNSPVSNYDRDTILLQIHPQVTTRKILLVGHSQGTFYTNELYNYLTLHGALAESIAVYNVAAPASFVAGDGVYLTSQNDKVINAVREAASKIKAKQPLPANIDIPLTSQEAADSFGGHSFSGVYLANASPRIVFEIGNTLNKLAAPESKNAIDTGCFIPPPKDFSYRAQQVIFAFADPIASGAVLAGGASMKALATAARGFGNAAAVIFAFEANLPRQGGASAPPNQSLPENTSATELKPSTPQTEIASKPAFSLGSAPASLSLERGESPTLGEDKLANLGT